MTHHVTKLITGAALLGISVISSAHAGDRYQMQTVDQGIIRLDTETGQVSQCTFEGDALVCKTATEDETSTSQEVLRLRAENEELRKRLAERGGDMPTDAEIEQTVSMIEKLTSAFLEVIKNLKDDMNELESAN